MKTQLYVTALLDDPTHFRRDDPHPVVRCDIEVCLPLEESFIMPWREVCTIRSMSADSEACGSTLEYEFMFHFV